MTSTRKNKQVSKVNKNSIERPDDLTRRIKNIFISHEEGFNVSEMAQRFITTERSQIVDCVKHLLSIDYVKETNITRPGNTGPEVVLKHSRFVDDQ